MLQFDIKMISAPNVYLLVSEICYIPFRVYLDTEASEAAETESFLLYKCSWSWVSLSRTEVEFHHHHQQESVHAEWLMAAPAAFASCVSDVWRLFSHLKHSAQGLSLCLPQVRRGQRTVQTETKYIELMIVNDYELVGERYCSVYHLFNQDRRAAKWWNLCFVSVSLCSSAGRRLKRRFSPNP